MKCNIVIQVIGRFSAIKKIYIQIWGIKVDIAHHRRGWFYPGPLPPSISKIPIVLSSSKWAYNHPRLSIYIPTNHQHIYTYLNSQWPCGCNRACARNSRYPCVYFTAYGQRYQMFVWGFQTEKAKGTKYKKYFNVKRKIAYIHPSKIHAHTNEILCSHKIQILVSTIMIFIFIFITEFFDNFFLLE